MFFIAFPLGLAALLLIAGVAINFANVIGRYVFQSAIYWAEEAMIYMAIWSIFLAAIAIAYDRARSHHGFLLGAALRSLEADRRRGMTAVTVAVCLFMAVAIAHDHCAP